jgi:hypothetical protein
MKEHKETEWEWRKEGRLDNCTMGDLFVLAGFVHVSQVFDLDFVKCDETKKFRNFDHFPSTANTLAPQHTNGTHQDISVINTPNINSSTIINVSAHEPINT